MSGKDECAYFDSCIFIAYLKNEQRPDPNDMAGVNDLIERIDRAEIQLATSVLSLSEVLERGVPLGTREDFTQLWGRQNCHLIEVNRDIAEIAHTIRDYYQQQSDGWPTLTTPDALHVATAISFGCQTFYTFDQNSRKGRKRGLTTLSPLIAGQYQVDNRKNPHLRAASRRSSGNEETRQRYDCFRFPRPSRWRVVMRDMRPGLYFRSAFGRSGACLRRHEPRGQSGLGLSRPAH